jgi:LysR family transcriptional activator of nhaA
MDWLNYHHLLYFWAVARTGSIAKASRELLVSQPTISTQIKALERSLGEKLFERVGRGLELTDTGQVVLSYAEEIFSLGRELRETVRHIPEGRPLRLRVGVADVVPKLLARRLLAPALDLPRPVHLIVREGKAEDLEAELGSFTLDLVLADAPLSPTVRVKAVSSPLGSCDVGFYGAHPLVRKHRRDFPHSLDDAPVLLPTVENALRRGVDRWLDELGIRPRVVGEFDDSALLKVFAQEGHGLFPAPVSIAEPLRKQYRAHEVGRTDRVTETIHAITVERRSDHPGIRAIFDAAADAMSE